MFLLSKLKEIYVNFRGFHTNRKLIVIESDDWGSIRMPSKSTYDLLLKEGDCTNEDAFLKNDSLESEKDLKALFDTLSKIKNSKGESPIFTANFAVANPNFELINYSKDVYAYEPFYVTYSNYYPDNNNIEIIKKAIDERLFFPQLHCREHLNVKKWMKDLKQGKKDTKIAFENKMIGIGRSFAKDNKFGYMDAFNMEYNTSKDIDSIINDANSIFSDVFGYKSATFVASCFVWNEDLEKTLYHNGIFGIQSSYWQNIPKKNGIYKRKIHFTGEKNKYGQIYLVRNCSYEPAYFNNPKECSEKCLEQIRSAFKNHKPAIINSHRFNYISSINFNNAVDNLFYLSDMLNKIIEEFPMVEFITSAELIEIIKKGSKK